MKTGRARIPDLTLSMKQVHAKACNEDKSLVHDQLLWLSLVKKNYFST